MQHRGAARIAGVVAAVGLIVGGCSGSSSGDSATGAKSTRATTTTVPKFSGQGSGALCRDLASLSRQGSALDADTSATAQDRQARWNELIDQIDSLAKRAPREIRSDLRIGAKFYAALRTAVSKYGYDRSKLPQAELDALLSKSVRDSSSRIAAYQQQLCVPSTTSTTGP